MPRRTRRVVMFPSSSKRPRVSPSAWQWRAVGRRPAAWALVFLLGLVLFLAPFFPSTSHFDDLNLYLYLYGVWGLLILLIALIAFCLPKFTSQAGQETKK